MFEIKVGGLVRLQARSKANPSYTHIYEVTDIEGDKCKLTCVKGGSRGVTNVNISDVFAVMPKMSVGQMLNFWDNLADEDHTLRGFNTLFHHCTLAGIGKNLDKSINDNTSVEFVNRISSRMHLLDIGGNKHIHEFGDTDTNFDR